MRVILLCGLSVMSVCFHRHRAGYVTCVCVHGIARKCDGRECMFTWLIRYCKWPVPTKWALSQLCHLRYWCSLVTQYAKCSLWSYLNQACIFRLKRRKSYGQSHMWDWESNGGHSDCPLLLFTCSLYWPHRLKTLFVRTGHIYIFCSSRVWNFSLWALPLFQITACRLAPVSQVSFWRWIQRWVWQRLRLWEWFNRQYNLTVCQFLQFNTGPLSRSEQTMWKEEKSFAAHVHLYTRACIIQQKERERYRSKSQHSTWNSQCVSA